MRAALGFDIYGTLIDTQGLVGELEQDLGERAPAFSRLWREKQLEYSFRRGLMGDYCGFATCTRDGLNFACLAFAADLAETRRESLLALYRTLPAYPDAAPALASLHEGGYALYAFSNGLPSDIAQLLEHNRLARYLAQVVSVDEVQSFKPDPRVYAHFVRRCGLVRAADAWLISSNSFDVLGALHAGLKAAWVRRDPVQPLDPWGTRPTLTVPDLGALTQALGPL